MRLLVTIGLDEPIREQIAATIEARVVSYPNVPRCHALDGRLRVESARVSGKWLEPDGVVFYSYFDDARDARRAIAIAATPSFPNVRRTLALDDKILALVLAGDADGGVLARGFVPQGLEVGFNGERVAKWGDRHCGDNKTRVTDHFVASEPTVLEPFVAGISERVLVVGEKTWQVRYESDDWRKNVGGTAYVVKDPDPALLQRGKQTADRLGLSVVGLDYITNANGAVLLEANAYPGFDDVPDAGAAFVDAVARWWRGVCDRADAVG